MNNPLPPRTTRREFLKQATATGVILSQTAAQATDEQPAQPPDLTPLDVVRVGFIGVGARGGGHVRHMASLDGVEIIAICDNHEATADATAGWCKEAGRPLPDVYARGDEDYRRMLERDDLDIVIIATPWRWHAQMSVAAMQAGKHCFVEVPAALTLNECWALVEISERTGRHCMMMENVCYGREELMVLNMCRQGLFGELTHGEGAYIHDLRAQMNQVDRGTGAWRTGYHQQENSNLYPTHGLGPIAQYMNINRGDRFDFMVSMSSQAAGRSAYARHHFPADHIRNQGEYVCGDMNSSLIQTVNGKSILVQHDTTTPRPYTRLNFIQGTRGAFGGFPHRITTEGRDTTHGWVQGESLAAYRETYEHPLWTRMGDEAEKAGGHGGMDFLMLWRMVYCLRNGEPLDQDVYDAAAWSAIRPLSADSVARRSRSVDVPDFTRGAWRTRPALGIVGGA